jgi:hypothetical protein
MQASLVEYEVRSRIVHVLFYLMVVCHTVLRIRDVYPGVEFFHPGSRIQGPIGTGSKLSEIQCVGSGMFFPDPDFFPSRIRIRNTAPIQVMHMTLLYVI